MQRRFMSLFALVAFGAAMASDAYGLHSCPHHDALPGESVHAAGSEADIHHAAAEHTVVSDQVRADADGSPEHDGHGVCTCVGTCSANPPSVPLESAHVTIAASLSTTSQFVPAYTRPHARTTPYLLPWATAPPVSASR